MANGHLHRVLRVRGSRSQWGNDGGNRGATIIQGTTGTSYVGGTGSCWGHGGSTSTVPREWGQAQRLWQGFIPLSPHKGRPSSGLHPQRDPSPWNTLLPQPCSQSHTLTQNSFAQVFIQS